MKTFLTLIFVFIFGGVASADTVADLVGLGMNPELAELVASLSTTKSNAAWFKARNQANSADINIMSVDATDDTVLNADSGDLVKVSVAGTPIAAVGAATPVAAFTPGATANWVINGSINPLSGFGGSISTDIVMAAGKQVQQAVAIITPSTNMTPAAASNLSSPINRLVAGSPTLAAVHLPAATPNKGKAYVVTNEGSNPALIFPNAAEKINAGGANTPITVAAGKQAECVVVANDTSLCASRN